MVSCLIACATNLEQRKLQSEAQRNVGEAYMVEGKYTLALKELLEAEKVYADDPLLQNYLGLAYMGKQKPELAVEHYKKAIVLKHDYAPAKNNLGTAYLALGDWDAAIVCFKELTENLLYATPQYATLNLGWAYYNKGAYQLAEKYYNETLKYYQDGNPKDVTYIKAVRGLGQTYVAMGKPSKAVAILEEVTQSYPHFALLHFDLARAYALTGDINKAIQAYRTVIERAPEGPLAKEAQKEIEKLRN
jgi:tetratricopeptide (TPR) repeat protein